MKSTVLSFLYVFICICSQAQSAFDVYISNSGNDANAGTSPDFPKKTINGAFSHPGSFGLPSRPVKVGLKAGDIFDETYNAPFPMQAATYGNTTANPFTIFNGSDIFDTGWVKTKGRESVYEQAVALTGFTGYGINGIGQYSFVYVFEIDKTVEKSSPITARKLLKFVYSLRQADETPGSFYEPITTNENPKKIYIHTSDGNAPGQNQRYRYEVTVRDRALNVTYEEGNHFENLWVRGYGAGNGMIPTGANSSFNHMILGPGAGIHHLVVRGGTINNTLFLPAPKNVSGYAVVFYDVEGFGRHNTISNSIFLDIKDPVYTHHDGHGSNFGALEFNNVFAFADSTDAGGFVQNMQTDSVFIKNSYSYLYAGGYNSGWAKYVDIKNSGFIDAINAVSFGSLKTIASINNTFIKTKGNFVNGIALADSIHLLMANSIIHLQSNPGGNNNNSVAGAFVYRAAFRGNHINATGNIFICDVDSSKRVLVATVNTDNGAGTTSDRWQNNVYVLLKGDKIFWRVTNAATNNGSAEISSFEKWKQQSGQDKNSLFFDLRNDHRGLKAIFSDPANGDYELANTFEANQIRALRAGMTKPISCFVKKPSYEEAAALIMNDEILTADVCRNPCVQKNIRGYNQLQLQQVAGKKLLVKWNLDDERGVEHYQLLRSFGNNDFTGIYSVQPKGSAVYTFTDSMLQPGVEYRYSVAVFSKMGGKCYSDIKTATIQNAKAYSIYPNPAYGKIRLGLSNYSGTVKLKISNVMGVIVYAKEINSLYGIPPVIDLQLLSKGLYWARIETGEQTVVQSFLLQ
jgi:Secretion system C-terminal sorting domain